MKDYVLRQAGGVHWLIHVSQEGVPYEEPVILNEVGADIWNMLENNMSREKIAVTISNEYGIDLQTATEDVGLFCEQLISFIN